MFYNHSTMDNASALLFPDPLGPRLRGSRPGRGLQREEDAAARVEHMSTEMCERMPSGV